MMEKTDEEYFRFKDQSFVAEQYGPVTVVQHVIWGFSAEGRDKDEALYNLLQRMAESAAFFSAMDVGELHPHNLEMMLFIRRIHDESNN